MSHVELGASDRGHGEFPRRRFSAVQFLIVIVVMLIALPCVEVVRNGAMIASGIVTAVLLSGVIAIGGRGRLRGAALALVAPAIAARWLAHLRPHTFPHWLATSTAIIFAGFIVLSLLHFVLRAEAVDANVLCAASSAYLMMGFLWSLGYTLVGQLSPNSFAYSSGVPHGGILIGFESMYFSYSTLTTMGYGDIVPLSRGARMLAIMEAIAGVFYMTMLIARLVSLYAATARHAPKNHS